MQLTALPNTHIFDSKLKRMQRARSTKNYENIDYLFKESANRIIETFANQEITRTFPTLVELGARDGFISAALEGTSGIKTCILSDSTPHFNKPDTYPFFLSENALPALKENSVDLIISNLNLHWVDDLPGTLIQINRALKDGGLFIGTLLGGETLYELKSATLTAEMTMHDGISPRISPFTLVKDAGALLQRAGFALPVSNNDVITVNYQHPLQLCQELRDMGESNALVRRRRTLTGKNTLAAICEEYITQFGNESGQIPATFEIITLTGWKS